MGDFARPGGPACACGIGDFARAGGPAGVAWEGSAGMWLMSPLGMACSGLAGACSGLAGE